MPTRVLSRAKERLGGALLLVLGLLLFWLTWGQVARTGQFNVGGAVMGPTGTVLGLALLLMPGYRAERAARGEDPAAYVGFDALTTRWRVVLALCIAATVLHLALLYNGLTPFVA